MKAALTLAILLAATSATATDFSGRGRLGETWVWPVTFQQALAPLAPLAREAVTSGQCPNLKVGEGNVVHSYDFDAKMKTRGSGENKRWEVAELKLLNPSSCEQLDAQVAALMRDAIPKFAEPYKDLDKNGYTRIPRVQLRLTN
jgi:hypothetical protein